jgi:circadian clock protein KaiB
MTPQRRTARTHSRRAKKKYVLRLYVAGLSPLSQKAIGNITSLCEEHLPGRYDLKVIDLFKNPEQASREQIFVTPTLIKKEPVPPCRFIGDLSNTQKLLDGLALRPTG